MVWKSKITAVSERELATYQTPTHSFLHDQITHTQIWWHTKVIKLKQTGTYEALLFNTS